MATERKTNSTDLSFYALASVLQNGMRLRSDVEEYLKPYGLSHGQYSVLLAVSEGGGRPVSNDGLARRLGRSRPTITKLVAKLLDAGYLSAGADRGDGRRTWYALSAKARRLLDEIAPGYGARIDELADGLDDLEKLQLVMLLNKLGGNGFRVSLASFSYKEKCDFVRRMCEDGSARAIDYVFSFLDDDADVVTTKIVDRYLGDVSNPAGVGRIEGYLFGDDQFRRNYAALYFARKDEWAVIKRAYDAGLIDYEQAYSK